ncbi:MAG: uracil permease [Clostridiales bacterium]|jgi:uracil permease|nr:uracil permease [Eubacteriales bacterium]MDH7566652.1 uracil permease [Clostridiales bacterium]
MQKKVIQVEEKVPILQGLPLSLQHLFAMFGASVLVPILFNQTAQRVSGDPHMQVIDPALVLLMNGIGTLIYLFLCKGKAPAYLGSSFAFLAPTFAVIASPGDVKTNFSKALGGFILAGLIFTATALIIGVTGTKWLDVVLPPATMGPIVALIGLELASTAVANAGLLPDANGHFDTQAIIISLFTLGVLIFGTLVFRGFLSVIPVLFAVVAGYVLAAFMGRVDYSTVTSSALIALPHPVLPVFNLDAMLVIAPAALVVISEHIGHLLVTSKIVDRDLVKDPGLHRSMLGDGLSTMISGFAGSVPTTTYGENMGVMAITKVYSVWVIGGAAVISIILAFVGKLSGIISSIPGPVMGGVTILMYGVIAASGIRILVESKVDYSIPKNLILTAVVFIVGVSGVAVTLGGTVQLKGMALATIVGILLSLAFYILEKLKLTNEAEQNQ